MSFCGFQRFLSSSFGLWRCLLPSRPCFEVCVSVVFLLTETSLWTFQSSARPFVKEVICSALGRPSGHSVFKSSVYRVVKDANVVFG